MRSSSHTNQTIQVIFIVFLMGVVAWLATGWQTQQPLQLSEQQADQLHSKPYFEAHLITPVNAQTEIVVYPYHHTKMHAM